MTFPRRHLLPLLAASAAVAAPAVASADQRFTIRGAGFGHGVGMSQYGALGFAQNGVAYDAILRHYYTDTALGTSDPRQTVRVILQSTSGSASFSGATRAGGRRVDPGTTYYVRSRAGGVEVVTAAGRRVASAPSPLTVTGPGAVRLGGTAGNGVTGGQYRGSLEFRAGSLGGVNAINAVSLEDYVAGVISRESPASWPAEALKAQAVAARTYAITTTKGGDGFDHYPDTRSQVYGGVSAETASTSAAVRATRGQVVTYDGEPVTTFFFSTSGGMTEDVENTSLGSGPLPWLKAVEDPYDDVSPKHRWGPIRLTRGQAQAKLGDLVKGRFRGIRVVRRGESPRIVAADVVGTRGRTRTDGATLRARLGLDDTWAYFTTISARRVETRRGRAATAGPGARAAIAGRVIPARRGAEVQVQRLAGGTWRTVTSTVVARKGRYSAGVARAGTYRAVFAGEAGAPVRIG